MKIYLDCCCLNRPFDVLLDDVVRMEAEAVITVIDRCENGGWELFTSDVLFDEIDNNPNLARKQKVLMLYQSAKGHIELTTRILARAKQLESFNIKAYDALHIASAEAGGVNVFLTTDRKLINAAGRSDTSLQVKNPLIWLTEVLFDEH